MHKMYIAVVWRFEREIEVRSLVAMEYGPCCTLLAVGRLKTVAVFLLYWRVVIHLSSVV